MSDLKSIVKRYFTALEEEGEWRCKCGKLLKQKKNSGWTNLFNHVKKQHPEYARRTGKTVYIYTFYAVELQVLVQ